jgi:CRP-like cAMP-binding protein
MKQILKVFKSISRLSPGLYAQLDEHAQYMPFKKGDLIKKAGQDCDNLYLIEKGIVKVYNYDYERQQCIWFKKENEFILQLHRVTGHIEGTKELGIQMLADGGLWAVPGQLILQFVTEFPEFSNHMSHLCLKEIIAIKEKVLLKISDDPTLRYDYLRKNMPDIFTRIEHTHLATFIGITVKEFLHLHNSHLYLSMSSIRHRKRKK